MNQRANALNARTAISLKTTRAARVTTDAQSAHLNRNVKNAMRVFIITLLLSVAESVLMIGDSIVWGVMQMMMVL